MSRAISEGSEGKRAASTEFGVRQLERRPATVPGCPCFTVFRAAIGPIADPEADRVHYPSAEGGNNVYWDTWDPSYDSTVFDIGPGSGPYLQTNDPDEGQVLAGLRLLRRGLYSIHAQIDLGQYFNGITLFNTNYDQGQAVYAEHNNAPPTNDEFLGDYYGIRLDQWRIVEIDTDTLPSDNADFVMGGEAETVEIVFAQNNNIDITYYGSDVGTVPLGSAGDPATPGQDVWIPGGYDGAWGLVPQLLVAYWGVPDEGMDPDWPGTFLPL